MIARSLVPALAAFAAGPTPGPAPRPATTPSSTGAIARATAPADAHAAGVYRLERVNGRALPVADRLVAVAGYQLVARVDRLLLNLNPSGRFTVDVHYQYANVVAGASLPIGGDWADADARGSWTVRDGHLTLRPDASKRGNTPPPLRGDWRHDQIVMDLRYAGRYTAGVERQYVVRLQRAPDLF
ncbi:MAG TPA: hypothetical protein VGD56_10490 [Gemmatirosa sp.]